MDLCQEAHARKLESGRAQVLVLYETEPAGLAAAEARLNDVIPVSLCCLTRIGHADLLHALASGFDVIHLQTCPRPSVRQAQDNEVELVRELGGLGRIMLFDRETALERRLAAGILPFPSVAPEILAVGSRRDTARASAAALLPPAIDHIGLPDKAPYGTVSLDESLCNKCSSCVWVCPSDALGLTENGGELSLVESLCSQCGLCITICPQRALHMEAGMDLSASAVLPQLLTRWEGSSRGEPEEAGGLQN
ncbi:4Fe-4S binding protein [Leisingera sp. ANG-Vp]|uniref:4Fe-4S binding protein n=1 Tax=Leisingera sp. ANG-Vp TaxID=1577896 RepID=UPI00068EAA2A|nr:4Fe-4S binding protein [Leisingera sp. ANG-Vp]